MKTRNIKFAVIISVFLIAITFILLQTVSVYADDIPDNGIPVVYINIDETQGTIQEMIESPNHSVYCYGTVSIVVPEGFHYSDFPDTACESFTGLSMSIRGRGNSTWQKSMKKPYKIKLDQKADLFGLGSNKHWALVANALDPTLIRDRITAWLGDEMGFEFTPRGVPVDLVMTGQEYGTKYLGSYYLSENVRVDKNRLEIDELGPDDLDDEVITGGYLIQNGTQVNSWSPDRFYTTRGACWATDTPSFDTLDESMLGSTDDENYVIPELGDSYDNSKQQQYIQNHVQLIEDTLFQGGTAYRELMDIESAAKYLLINDFCLNADAYATGSTYFYKVRDVDGKTGKIYWGPLWDFDYAWNNKNETTGFDNEHVWLRPMFCDKSEGGFVQEIKKQWPALRTAVLKLIEDGGIIDQYYEETKASAAMDAPINRAYEPDFDYKTAIDELKTWIKERLQWFDENIDSIDDLVHTVTFKVGKEVYMYAFKDTGMELEEANICPEKEGYVFLGWKDENGNTIDRHMRVYDDTVLTASFVSLKKATKGQDIAFRSAGDITKISPHTSSYQIQYEVVPTDAQDKSVVWTSSNIATVDEDGIIHYTAAGEVTISAKLSSGKEKSFVLTITEEDLTVPGSIKTDKEKVELKTGEQTSVTVITDPFPARIHNFIYESEDGSIATVDEYGVITAISTGETKIKIKTVTESDSQIILESFVDVSVTEKSKVIPFVIPLIFIVILAFITDRIILIRKNRT